MHTHQAPFVQNTPQVSVVSSPGPTRPCSARRLSAAQVRVALPKAASRRKALRKVVRNAVEVVRHRRKRRVLIAALLSLLATVALKPPLLSRVTPLHIALLSLTRSRPVAALLATVAVALEPPLLPVIALLPVAAILPLTQSRSISGLLSLLTTDLVTCALEPRLLSVVTLLSTEGALRAPTLLPLTQSRPIAGLLSLLTTDLVACALEPRLLSVVTLLPKATLATR